MWVFELTVPGVRLEMEDRQLSWELEGLLRHLEGSFFEANTALNLFHQARIIDSQNSSFSPDDWERDRARRSEIQDALIKARGGYSHDHYMETYFEAEVIHKREKWSQGHIPRELKHNVVFIHARAFLYAMDAFDKFLTVLSKTAGVPPEIVQLSNKMDEHFPDLRGVRNSAQHQEDRARGLGVRGAKIDLKPIDNTLVKAPGGVLMLNCLNGSKYGSTMADGHYGEVDVSPKSMQHLQSVLIEVLNCFNWSGPKRHLPSD
ncbi:hypothetical protein [Pseudomonas parafulva]|uniref:hypothetical protein n=1 Tax=Pseudomonas parafulva TaxID=157782 RepID=UPI00073501A7|nr:hypothetical protein [Pseudomonas parafulva]KTT02135.1 hypothetical protein NS212_03055 [Pseudomonas parafulva]